MRRVHALVCRLDVAIAQLTPAYFAFVMATGIVALAMLPTGVHALSTVLLWIAGVALVGLVVLNILRVARHRRAVADDFGHPRRTFGFFTFVAAVCVVGAGTAPDPGLHALSMSLLVVGVLALLVLDYTVPWTTVRGARHARPIHRADGSWFIWPVACQAVAVLAATLERDGHADREVLALLAVLSWSVGAFLYCGIGIIVVIRLMSYRSKVGDVTAPYWVAMGATAITVVAGTRIAQMADAPMTDATRGLIAATAVFFWAFGTWLVPPLLVAGWWRHVRHHVPVRYAPELWAIIFPLGMYAVGSQSLGDVDGLPLVSAIGRAESWVALAAWLVTFAAMLASVWRHVLRGRPAVAPALSSTASPDAAVTVIIRHEGGGLYGGDGGTLAPPVAEHPGKHRGRHAPQAAVSTIVEGGTVDTGAIAEAASHSTIHVVYAPRREGRAGADRDDPARAPIRVTKVLGRGRDDAAGGDRGAAAATPDRRHRQGDGGRDDP